MRDELRLFTRTDHERLHQHARFIDLFDGRLTIKDYEALVERLYGFYAPVDQAICRFVDEYPSESEGYEFVSRADLLAQDMVDLGFSRAAVAKAPHCSEAFDLISEGSFGGVIYVLEGATLGGSRIDRLVQDLLGHEDSAGRAFWFWCRTQSKARWQMANRHLERLEAQGASVSELKTGAKSTFRLLADWLAPLDQTSDLPEPVRA